MSGGLFNRTLYETRVPIFFVGVKTYRSLANLSVRGLADDQMRDLFPELVSGSIPTPKFIGISSFGTQFCVYSFTSETWTFELALITADAHVLNDVTPQDRWALDILNDEGEAKLREVVGVAKSMAANL